ncbi:MAG: hypothetical protein RQ982_05995 [Gammaproteobacteria bacterium]|nr:hypothetical protein [Gammaproteobacteria bacterium]
MHYTKKISLCVFFALVITTPALADIAVDVSARLLNFHYEEFDQSGETFNKENGIIPGLSIATSKALSNFTNTISIEAYDGQVDYDGQTQVGAPHSTNTDETLYRLFYKLNWSPEESRFAIYGRVAWQQWNRDILSMDNVSGLFERYRWWTLEAGISAILFENDADKWQFELGASKVSNGTIKVDLERFGYGKPELDLGDGHGISGLLKYQHQITYRDNIGLAVEHRYWTFGRSNSKTLSNNIETITITEPRSVTNHSIISVNYAHYF